MALTKENVVQQIEIVGDHKIIQVATATVIKDDGVEVSRTLTRTSFNPSQDVSGQSAEIQAIAATVWTDEIIADYNAWQEALREAKEAQSVSE